MNVHHLRHTLIEGALAGLTAALLMLLLLAGLRSTAGIPSPAEMIGDRVAPVTYVYDFLGLLERFGGYNQAKLLLGMGSIVGVLVVGTLIGLAYAVVVERERGRASKSGQVRIGRAGSVFLIGSGALIWLLAIVLLGRVLGINYRGLPAGPATIATACAYLIAFAAFGAALVVAHRFLAPPDREGDSRPGQAIGRRAVILGGVAVALAGGAGATIRHLYQRATFAYDGMEYNEPDPQPIVPNDRFYVVTKNIIDPNVDRGLWRLDVDGHVDRPRTYRFEDLAALPAVTQATTLMCISNQIGAGLMSNAVWKGVPLRDLLAAAGAKPGAVEVIFHAVDSYTDTFSIQKAMDPTTLVAYEMNGEPLPETHGYPARILAPGLFGEKNVKWVARIEVVDHEAKGFYESQGWGPSFVIPTRSRFTAPDFRQPLAVGSPVLLKGVAFGGDRGVSRVEVSLDGGQTWRAATLDYPGERLTWALWSYPWRPDRPGDFPLVVRATDGAGGLQTGEVRDSVPQGATGLHRVVARVQV